MDSLDSDSLSLIFSLFSFKERVRLERVCRRWKDVMHNRRVYVGESSFNIGDYLYNNNHGYFQQDSLSFEPTTLSILKRCGPFLKQLSFGSRWLRITPTVLQSVADHCERLTVLDLSASILSSDLTPVLQRVGPQLRVLSLEDTSWSNTDNAKKAGKSFRMMEKLEEVYLRNCGIDMVDILDFPGQLRKTDLSSNWQLTAEILVSFLINQRELISLALCPFPGGQFPKYSDEDPSDGIEAVIECLSGITTLQELSLGQISYEPRTLSLAPLGRLTNLKILEFRQVMSLTGETITEILQGATKLQQLTVVHCQKVDDYRGLYILKDLETLQVERTPQICDQDVLDVAVHGKLKAVALRRCYNIEDDAVVGLATNCNLEELDLTDSDGVTDLIFDVLEPIHTLRSLFLGGCKKLTEHGIRRLIKGSLIERLEQLDLSRNKNFTNYTLQILHEAIRQIPRKRPLQVFGFQTQIEERLAQIVCPEIELIIT
ncbi:unnamed protein product [Bursaphelenchus xylophilus]|uniref:(pine wood nematode) hypothetical protein n=1 Tax=Bursaphelenchus xylophilus TaxID=6326 RepID=A0A1I7RTT9_BURXY|nr:unnamed protein product [Bursaphelenchus xylophilus]CAG9122118.1 unnamed protein product [Bursaphelenchus xylophilus]